LSVSIRLFEILGAAVVSVDGADALPLQLGNRKAVKACREQAERRRSRRYTIDQIDGGATAFCLWTFVWNGKPIDRFADGDRMRRNNYRLTGGPLVQTVCGRGLVPG
jgi:hypothetical protein